jgi:Na+-transporting NADH:ubiquinone oxidoreductase subunit NqrF
MDAEIQSNGGAREAGRSSLHEVLAAGDALLRVLAATQEGIGCGCGGDYGLCSRCSKAYHEAEEAAEAWETAKKAANNQSATPVA